MRKRAWKRIYEHAAHSVYAGGGRAGDADAAGGTAFDNPQGIAERMGCVVRGGMNAYETAKKEDWDAGKAFFGDV